MSQNQKSFNQKLVIGIAFAAGRGTRMQPLTDTLPKPLIEIEGKSLMEWNLFRSLKIVDQYLIIVNWLKEKIIEKITDKYLDKKVNYIIQETYNGGTLQAFLDAINSLDSIEKYNYLVFNTDEIRGEEFYNKILDRISKDPNINLICGKILQDKSKLSAFGVLQSDSEGKLEKIVEKPVEYISSVISIGLYYFSGEKLKKYLPGFLNEYVQTTKEKYLPDLIDYLVKYDSVEVISSDSEFRYFTTVNDLDVN